MTRAPRSSTSVPPGRFQLHGLEVEVEPTDDSGWRARVVAPAASGDWHYGRHAWPAIDAAALAHLASGPADEAYRRLLDPSGAGEAAGLVAA
jgi:hypothetical protein